MCENFCDADATLLTDSYRPKGTNSTKQEAQLMLTNPRDAFRGQSRSPSIVPFHMLGIVSSCAIVTLSLFDIRLQKMSWPWNPDQRSLKVIESGTIR